MSVNIINVYSTECQREYLEIKLQVKHVVSCKRATKVTTSGIGNLKKKKK